MFPLYKQFHFLTYYQISMIIIDYIILLIIINHLNAQYIQPGLCETQCHCPKDENVVHCDRQDHIQGVPTNIPNGITKLFIQQSNFPIPNYINQANMTGLEKLEYLRIIYCNLQVIESRTFMRMIELKHLDLSHNALIRIDAYTFYGLQLNSLYLREQHSLPIEGMIITEESFHGLLANQINLRGNRIQSISYEIFGKVPNLDRLILSDNRIIHIDNGFERYFNYPNKLLDLTGNPLECNCHLAWIVQRSLDWKDSLPGLNMTCIHITTTAENSIQVKHIYELVKLTPDQLCPTSRIQQIFINILDDPNRALISCTAVTVPKRTNTPLHNIKNMITSNSILSHTPPGVAWRYIEDGQLREVRYLTSNNNNNNNSSIEPPSSTVQLNITLDIKPHKYTCTTWDDKKETEEVIVTLKGPEMIHLSKINNTLATEHDVTNHNNLNNNNNNNNNNRNYYIKQSDDLLLRNEILFDQSHYYFYQKQFTLLEMSIAVISTFLTTLIFLLISAKCLRLCRHYKLFHFSSSCHGINDTKSIYQPVKLLHNNSNSNNNNSNNNSNDTNMIEHNNYNIPLKFNDYNKTNGYNLIRTHINPYSQMILSTLNNQNTTITNTNTTITNTNTTTNNSSSNINNNFSPQMNQYPNLTNQYLTVTCTGNGIPSLPLPSPPPSSSLPFHLASSSGSGTNDDLQQSLALLTSTPLIQQNKLRNFLNNDTTTIGLSPFLGNTQPNIRNWLIAPGSPYSITGSHVYDVPRTIEINQGTLPMSTGLGNRSSLLSESE
ncbi:unnamed protein product [Schistosoma rodhaini]|uniref:Ig-like domain-containing protein n=1 Tax=Schistosoma rodhaini TaxID=6188 RepID=A0AA85FTE8_9TREM|nr:unnamed protein product [Schistosoma rodhaini]